MPGAPSGPHAATPTYMDTMPARKPRPTDAKSQSERFIETARALGVPEDEAAFGVFKEKWTDRAA